MPLSVRLQTLYRKRHLFQNPVEERKRPGGRPAPCQTGDQEATAVVDCRELVESRPYLARVHLYPITRERPAVSLWFMPPLLACGQCADAIPNKHLVDGGCVPAVPLHLRLHADLATCARLDGKCQNLDKPRQHRPRLSKPGPSSIVGAPQCPSPLPAPTLAPVVDK